jgi:hypothetical protein
MPNVRDIYPCKRQKHSKYYIAIRLIMNIFTIIDKKITRHTMAVISGKRTIYPPCHGGYKRVGGKCGRRRNVVILRTDL